MAGITADPQVRSYLLKLKQETGLQVSQHGDKVTLSNPTKPGPSVVIDLKGLTQDQVIPALNQKIAALDGKLGAFKLEKLVGGELDGLADSILGNRFDHQDRNKDGVLTGTEAKRHEDFDSNQDGAISKEEFIAGRKADVAQTLDDRSDKTFDRLDKNKDGFIATENKKLLAFDTDKDGRISREEFKGGREAKREAPAGDPLDKSFDKLDKNHDGGISAAENKQAQRFDTNNDGIVSREEYKARDKAPVEKPVKPPKGDPKDKAFDKLDTDHDGTVSREEFKARPKKK